MTDALQRGESAVHPRLPHGLRVAADVNAYLLVGAGWQPAPAAAMTRAAAQVDNLCYERQIEKLCDVGAGWQPAPAAESSRAAAQVENLCYERQVENLCDEVPRV